MLPEVRFCNLGLIDYKEAWDLQEVLFNESIQKKIRIRNGEEDLPTVNHLLFCEHPHVYTLGKSGSESNLLLNEIGLTENDATYYKINRGGDITYHGPGQLVAYPIFDLDYFFTDIHKYMRYLEEAVIKTLAHFQITATRYEGLTGVWIDAETPKARKICAMGVKCSRWITMHGIALNVHPDLGYFGNIVPCGIQDKAVTSMAQELGRQISIQEVQEVLLKEMSAVFNFSIQA